MGGFSPPVIRATSFFSVMVGSVWLLSCERNGAKETEIGDDIRLCEVMSAVLRIAYCRLSSHVVMISSAVVV
jgi:hypothetical protein